MKRTLILAIIALVGLSALAQASVVSFTWGTSFLQLGSNDLRSIAGGTTGSIQWYADDLSFGILSDSIGVIDPTNTTQNSGKINVTEITLDKWLSKSVAVGLGVGTALESNDYNSSDGAFENDGYAGTSVEIRGTVQLLSGKGDKINASLDFNIAERFINVPGQFAENSGVDISSLRGTVATLAVTLGL